MDIRSLQMPVVPSELLLLEIQRILKYQFLIDQKKLQHFESLGKWEHQYLVREETVH